MSESSADDPVFIVDGAGPAPLEALREALFRLAAALAEAGCGPQHLVEAICESRAPAALHPARDAVDLVWREAFGGARPPVRLRRAVTDGVTLRVRARRPAPPDPDMIAAARAYAPRLQTDMRRLFADWTREGEAFRVAADAAGRAALDLAYGRDRFATLDLFLPEGEGPWPVWVFIHGGYWQASDKAQHAHFAAGMLAAGFAVAMPNYGLAPETPIETAIGQTVGALAFLAREAENLDLDRDAIHVAGHSAGAHLAAMAALDPLAPPLRSALLLSGLFDLAPLVPLPVGAVLGLDAARAQALSPIHAAPLRLPCGLAVGGRETDAFKAQSARMADAWGAPAPLIVPDAHHFNLLDGLNGGPLCDLACAVAGAAR